MGVVRKTHLKPRLVMLAATEFADHEGDAVALGHGGRGEGDVRMVAAQHRHDVLLGDQAQRLVLALGGIALVVRVDELELRPAQLGQARRRPDRQAL